MNARHVETPQESRDRLRLEVDALRASRKRLAVAADSERRGIERDLHDGPLQHLVALAANLQLARRLVDSDPAGVKALLDEMAHDVQQALDEIGKLAHRIHPPLLEAGGLGAALRTAAEIAGVRARVEVAADVEQQPEIAGAVYRCCLEAIEEAGPGAQVTIRVQVAERALVFEVTTRGAGAEVPAGPALEGMRDRIEALGGRLEVGSDSGRGPRISGSLPLSR